jgi:hypothetical protein
MAYINLTTNQYYFGNSMPPGDGWQQVTIEEFNALRASGWNPTAYVPPYRVSKDTITGRVLAAGKIADLMTLLAGLPPEQQFLWSGFSWFWSDNATVRGMAAQLGLNPDEMLAPDPYL